MFDVLAADKALIASVPALDYVRFNRRNKMAVGCDEREAEGITLNSGRDVYRFIERAGLENVPKCTIVYRPIDAVVVDTKRAVAEMGGNQEDAYAEILLGQAEIAITQMQQDDTLSAMLLDIIS